MVRRLPSFARSWGQTTGTVASAGKGSRCIDEDCVAPVCLLKQGGQSVARQQHALSTWPHGIVPGINQQWQFGGGGQFATGWGVWCQQASSRQRHGLKCLSAPLCGSGSDESLPQICSCALELGTCGKARGRGASKQGCACCAFLPFPPRCAINHIPYGHKLDDHFDERLSLCAAHTQSLTDHIYKAALSTRPC